MSKQEATAETVLLPESDLIPLALIAIEVGESVDRLAHRFDEVVEDDIGMRAVAASVAREFFHQRAERKSRRIAEQRRRTEEAAALKKVVPAGAPAQEGMTPMEALVAAEAAAGTYTTPKDDYGLGRGSATTELLEAELAEGQRDLARKRAEAAEKRRLADKMKDDLQ